MRLPSKNAPLHAHVAYFVRHHLGDDVFAPFTGQDLPAWRAFVYLVECWCAGGGDDAIAAMRATVRCAQPKVWQVFVQTIPAVGDWPHVAQLWPRIVDGEHRLICAIERWGDEPKHARISKYGWNGLTPLDPSSVASNTADMVRAMSEVSVKESKKP